MALNPAGIFHRKLVLREHRFLMDCWSALPENVYAQDGAGWINIMDRLLGNGREFLLQSCLLRFLKMVERLKLKGNFRLFVYSSDSVAT